MPDYPRLVPKPLLRRPNRLLGETHAEVSSARFHPQLDLNIPNPQPPTINRAVVEVIRVKNPLTEPSVRVKLSLTEAIDYCKLSATKQASWDMGIFGSIELKKIKNGYYFYLRWREPQSKKYRSTYLGKEWDKAIAKLKKLTTADGN